MESRRSAEMTDLHSEYESSESAFEYKVANPL
jgi:hypothetical protein